MKIEKDKDKLLLLKQVIQVAPDDFEVTLTVKTLKEYLDTFK